MTDRDNSGWAAFGKFIAVVALIAGGLGGLYGIWYWGGTSAIAEVEARHTTEMDNTRADYEERLDKQTPQLIAMAQVLADCLGDENCRKAFESVVPSQGRHLLFHDGDLYRTCVKWTTPNGRGNRDEHVAEALFKLEYNPRGRVVSVHYPKVTATDRCSEAIQTASN